MTIRGPMILPDIPAEKDLEDVHRLINKEMRKRYPFTKKVTVRKVRGEVQVFCHGVLEVTEEDDIAIGGEIGKAKKAKPKKPKPVKPDPSKGPPVINPVLGV